MELQENGQIAALNEHMFGLLKELNDPNADTDKTLKKAQVSVQVGTVIVNNIKAGIEFMKVAESAAKREADAINNKQKKLGDGK